MCTIFFFCIFEKSLYMMYLLINKIENVFSAFTILVPISCDQSFFEQYTKILKLFEYVQIQWVSSHLRFYVYSTSSFLYWFVNLLVLLIALKQLWLILCHMFGLSVNLSILMWRWFIAISCFILYHSLNTYSNKIIEL